MLEVRTLRRSSGHQRTGSWNDLMASLSVGGRAGILGISTSTDVSWQTNDVLGVHSRRRVVVADTWRHLRNILAVSDDGALLGKIDGHCV
jgi:hypothetical protein